MAHLPAPYPAPANPAQNQPVNLTPADPVTPAPAAPQIIHQQVLNWSHLKPEFAGRPEEDAEAYHLHTNDWMSTHNFPKDVKYRGFV